jgi:hypothetical protein
MLTTNLYGTGDNYHLKAKATLCPPLVRTFMSRNQPDANVFIWRHRQRHARIFVRGRHGRRQRVRSSADGQTACGILPMQSHINVGGGKDVTNIKGWLTPLGAWWATGNDEV